MKRKPESKDTTAPVILTLSMRVGCTHPLLGCEVAGQALRKTKLRITTAGMDLQHGPAPVFSSLAVRTGTWIYGQVLCELDGFPSREVC